MNREIKFRAWNREKGRMFRIARFDFSDYTIYSHPFACDGFLGEVCEIMQYTGSKDMNGVEIYEGDILQSEYYLRYQVVFKGDCWRCEPLKNSSFKNRFIGRDLEVIGNIYENPELLKEDN